jgi:hypothetical protein
MKNEKHEFLYNYARAAFEDELQRFRNIEDKSAKYLSLLSVGVVSYTIILRFYSASFFPAETVIQWLACIVVAITYLAMASSWSFLYRALRFTDMPRLPLDEEFINKYEPESLPTIHFALTRTCSDAIKYARKGNLEKSKLLIKGYKYIALSMWALTLSVILILSFNLTTKREITMSEEEKSSKSTQQQTSAEPNKDVPPPKVTFVLDHAIPKVEKGQQQINESGDKSSEK